MKVIVIAIIALLILLVVILFYYFNGTEEAMTNQEAGSILPVIYDSSLSSKNKITDLLGIPVNDDSYNKILNSNDKDTDAIISNIKTYIGSSVTFNTTSGSGSGSGDATGGNGTNTIKEPLTPYTPTTTLNNSAPTDAITTKPTTMKVNHKTYAQRLTETQQPIDKIA
jgi:hypothetical protein